jgi:hypothetical protein
MSLSTPPARDVPIFELSLITQFEIRKKRSPDVMANPTGLEGKSIAFD